MSTDTPARGFQALAIAAGCFLIAGLVERLEAPTLLGFALSAAGFVLASTARTGETYHWGRVGLGGLIAYIGMMPFFFEAFFPLEAADWTFGAFSAFLVGLLGVTVGAFLALRFGNHGAARLLTRAGALSMALAGLLWAPLDILGGTYWWTPGNLATFVGALVLLIGLARTRAASASSSAASKA
jgi:hypothetical protein